MHYCIVGNGVAGITAAFTLRERDPRARITVIGGESDYFFSRTALMYVYLDRMTRRDLEPFERKVYSKQRLNLLRAWVTDLDASRHTLTLHDGRLLSYDKLLLAVGSVPVSPPWTGLNQIREGAVHFVSLPHLAECERLTPSTTRAVIAGGGLLGVELAECLRHHGVAVDFLIREPWYWPAGLSREEGQLVARHLAHHGVTLHCNEEVHSVEAGPGGRLAAVITRSGLRLPCQMLGITIGVRPATDWLQQAATPPRLGQGILVNPSFQTSLPDVFAAGDCAEFTPPDGSPLIEQLWYGAKRQGALAARAMLGDPVSYQPPLFFNSARFFDIDYTTVGAATVPPADATEFFYAFPDGKASVRIVARHGAVVGFTMLGARWDHTVLERWIAERRSLAGVIANLHLARFDPEFSRLPLAQLRAAFAVSPHALSPAGAGGSS